MTVSVKYSKKRFRLDVRKFSFSNRVVDKVELSICTCVNFCTINTFKKHVSVSVEPEAETVN